MPSTPLTRRAVLILVPGAALGACTSSRDAPVSRATPASRAAGPMRDYYPNETPELRRLIRRYANRSDVPMDLVQRVIVRESTHRPHARNGPYMGLMQIHPRTARGMGYDGPAEGLLDAETNLEYAVKYLRGAWLVSRGNRDEAVNWYARGYYYEAKRLGLLEETGLAG